jgi:serine/threonine-protein kinase
VSSDQRSRKRPPERLAGRYLVQDEIGSGASAITYRGWDERLERSVAIKLLREHYAQDDVFVRRFEREARAAASISHGNVVDVYDVGREGDALYIVMQLIEGEDLKHLIQREAPLAPERVQAIIGQVLDGLQAIHAAGIVHRDIKPQNILIDRGNVARVADFGIAQAEDDSGMTTEGTTVGTAAYMAPEQAQAGRITEATDLYAVGVILYEMLTGFLPFNGPTTVALMLEHIQATAVPPSQRLPGRGISSSMDAVILQALAKNPADRFRSARAMKQAVTQVFRGGSFDLGQTTVAIPVAQATRQVSRQPVSQRPPQRRMVAQPVEPTSVERERAGLGGVVAGFALILLLAVAGGAAWYAYDAWQESQNAGDPTPVATVPAGVQPTATLVPTATAPPEETTVVIEPVKPTEAPLPTDTPAPTATDAPTVTPEPTATDEPALIEPIDGTPLSLSPEQDSDKDTSDEPKKDEKKQDKDRNKKEDKDKDKKQQGDYALRLAVMISGDRR